MRFPKTVEAVAAMEKCQWRIGDALLAEIPVGKSGERTEAFSEIRECAEELAEQGYELSESTLKAYRLVASAFPAHLRRSAVSWTAHKEAGTPEMLAAILKIAGSKKKIAAEEIRQTKEVVQQHQQREYREEQRAAGTGPRKPLRLGRPSPIRSEHIGGMRLLAEVMRHTGRLEEARDIIAAATEFVRENLTKLDAEDTEGFTDYAMDIVKKGHKLADVAQRLADRRKKHLSVVGG